MGLDCFWVKSQVVELEFDPPLNLCGGLFSSSGSGSFRGKAYDQLIEDLTGNSLYERLTNGTVREIAEILRDTWYNEELGKEYDITEQEFKDLTRMFEVYAEEGCALEPWY